MSTELFTILVFVTSLAAGLLGSLTGLGGGGIIIPILVLLMGVDMRYAIGASLIAVIATSSGAAAAFVREGFTNVRLAMLLEVATVGGAIIGALLAAHVPVQALTILLGLVMLWTAWQSRSAPPPVPPDVPADPLATRLRLDSTYPSRAGDGTSTLKPYHVRNVPGGFAMMTLAGVLSALVGVGGGILKVAAMDRMMRVPFKVSTTTSNFMIGVTAAASAGVYLHRGQIDPRIATPVALGALGGSLIGARLLPHIKTKGLRIIFAVVVAVLGVQMIIKGVR